MSSVRMPVVAACWSQDAHRLAAIRSTGDGTDALISAIP
jgi:hypothetical protein